MSFTPNRRSIFAPTTALNSQDSFISGSMTKNNFLKDESQSAKNALSVKKSSSLIQNSLEVSFQESEVPTDKSSSILKKAKTKIDITKTGPPDPPKGLNPIFQMETLYVPTGSLTKRQSLLKKTQKISQNRSSQVLPVMATPPMSKEYRYRSSVVSQPKMNENNSEMGISERLSTFLARRPKTISTNRLDPLIIQKFNSQKSNSLPQSNNLYKASFLKTPAHLNRKNSNATSSVTPSSETSNEEEDLSASRMRIRKIFKKGLYATYFVGIMMTFRSKVKIFGAIRPLEYLEAFESFKPPETKETTFPILPSSCFSLVWGLTMMFLVIITAILTPIYISFVGDDNQFFTHFNVIIDIVFAFDIAVNFLSAYYDPDSNKVITDFRKIALNYLRVWFWIDIISILPVNDMIESATAQHNKFSQAGIIMKLLRLPRMYKLLKIIRLVRVAKFLSANRSINLFLKRLNLNARLLKVLRFFINFAFLNHFVACMWFFVARLEDFGPDTWVQRADLANEDLFHQYIASVYLTFQTLSTVGYGELAPESFFERAISVGGTLAGVLIYSYMLINFSRIFVSFDSQRQFKNKLISFENFARQAELPYFLRQKVRRFFEINQKECAYHCVDPNQMCKSLSVNLKTSLLLFSYYDKIRRIRFLQINANLTASLLVHFKFLSVKRGEIIYREDDPALEVYFILSGRIKFVTHEAKEIYALSEGTYFGEIEVVEKVDKLFNLS